MIEATKEAKATKDFKDNKSSGSLDSSVSLIALAASVAFNSGMRLLIVTQKVDRTDPILGFFHRWLEEFAGHFERVTVISQFAGAYSLQDNVKVCSMGKEKDASRISQVVRFWKLQWSLRKEYDGVLVHMTPVWVVLGWPVWFVLRRKIYLWYEIKRGSWELNLALSMVTKVFSATAQGLPRIHKKHAVTGHGIDVDAFGYNPEPRDGNLILSVGRITSSKRHDVIIKAFAKLPEQLKLFIAGGTIRKDDEEELKRLETIVRELGIVSRVKIQWVNPQEMPVLYQRASFLMNACEGGLDKAVLEAMACGCLVVSCAEAAREVLPETLICTDETMRSKAEEILEMSLEERGGLAADLRERVVQRHSLKKLVPRLADEMS